MAENAVQIDDVMGRFEGRDIVREKALKVVLVLAGLLFTAAIYPAVMLLNTTDAANTGDGMMMSIYFTLGLFLLLSVRNPAEHRSLIAFAAWSSLAHAAEMGTMGIHMPEQRTGFEVGSGVLILIGIALLALSPRKQSADAISSRAAFPGGASPI
jgi:hypothetical protein